MFDGALDLNPEDSLHYCLLLGGGDTNTLYSVMDKGVTAMGSRLLRRWLEACRFSFDRPARYEE